MKAMTSPSKWPTSCRLAIVARPRGEGWLSDEIAALSRYGYDVLVSINTPGEAHELGLAKESEECSLAGMKFINFPMPNDQFFCNVDAIAELVRRGRSVAVHCRADRWWSSFLAFSALVRLGWLEDKAFETVKLARRCALRRPYSSEPQLLVYEVDVSW